jgi:hypothetical protein
VLEIRDSGLFAKLNGPEKASNEAKLKSNRKMTSPKLIALILMSAAVGFLAVEMLKPINVAIQDNQTNSDRSKEIVTIEDENKTSITVHDCLQLKTELDPFNLLMALNQSTFSVADFTTLNIEEIRQCLNFLEIFQQQVRLKGFLFEFIFYSFADL